MLVNVLLKLIAIASLLGVAAWAQQQQASPWKDRAEYDLYNSIIKEQDNNKKVQLLDQWTAKYPETNFKEARLLLYTQAYQALGQAQKMYDSAIDLLKVNPKNIQGLYYVTSLTTTMGKTDSAFLATGEKSAKELLAELAKLEKPANLSEADFKKQKDGLEVVAHTAIGWIAMNRKNHAEAEQHFKEVLRLTPRHGQVSYWLGTVMIAQRDPKKQIPAFYHFARAAALTGEGAMPEAGRKQVESYLRKIYTTFHGDESGLNELLAMAQKEPFPPADLVIKSKEQIEFEKAEQLKRENPKLALWLSVKEQLTAEGGMEFFNTRVKNTAMPELRGYLIAQSPEDRPKTLVLGLSDRNTREVTLELDAPYKYPAPRGTVIDFECVPQRFTQQPFNLGFDCEQSKVNGWPPPPRRRITR